MTAQHPAAPGHPAPGRTPQDGEWEDSTPRWPAVVGGTVRSVFIAVNALLLASALYAKPPPAKRRGPGSDDGAAW